MFHMKHAALVVAALSIMPAAAQAQEQRLYIAGGADVWTGANTAGHGYALLEYQRDDLWRGGMLDVTLNTDTLWVALDGVRVADWLVAGAMIKGQYGFSGLLPDYYVQGARDRTRGFNASYGQARTWVKGLLAPHYVEVEASARRWSFDRNDSTDPALALPSVGWVFEPRVRYTLWLLDDDAAIREPHRHTWRLRGVALGAEVGLDVRDRYAAFGATEAAGFDDPDRRNDARQASRYGLVWLRAGRQLHERLRLQTSQALIVGRDVDDLNRWRLGGLNPYVAPVAGLPWASYLSSNVWSAEVAAMARVAGDHEVGAVFHAARFSRDEALRTGDGQRLALDSGVYGAGLVSDLRFGDWQVEAKLGWALPTEALLDEVYLEGWLSVGYRVF